MLFAEYRICLPMTVDEYKVAQLYTIAKFSEEQSKNEGEGVIIKKTEPFKDGEREGVYTEKEILCDSKVPAWLKYILPAGSLVVHERAWNAYPYTKSTYDVPFLGDRFSMTIETIYKNDHGTSENALNIGKDLLKSREIINVDLRNDEQTWFKDDSLPLPSEYHSEKTGRGPLKDGWRTESEPVMCAYKLVKMEFKYWGLQTKVESYTKWVMSQIFLGAHRKAFVWMDEWYGMSMEDVRTLEEKTKAALDKSMEGKTSQA